MVKLWPDNKEYIFFEASSKENINVQNEFYDVAKHIIEKGKGKKVFNSNLELNKKLDKNRKKKGENLVK